MPKKGKLDLALDRQVEGLDGVQAEMVKAHIGVWKWNSARIKNIQELLKLGKVEGEPLKDSERTSLINERHKLVTENGQLYSHINRALKDAPEPMDEDDAFIAGK